jgi:RNA recognition motif-containing protein
MTKREREQAQKDKLRAREARREDRRIRAAERAAAGIVGPPMGAPEPPLGELPSRAPIDREPPPWKDSHAGAKLFVGHLSFDTTAEVLREVFAEQGPVFDVQLMVDRDTGRSRGFAFVTMGSPAAASAAMRELNGRSIDGRQIRVDAASQPPRARSFGRR